MSKTKKGINISFKVPGIGIIGAICTTIIGQTIHSSFWWGIVDFLLWPLVWVKWLICKDVNMSIIKDAFSWFLQ
jgi:hypothetical protein